MTTFTINQNWRPKHYVPQSPLSKEIIKLWKTNKYTRSGIAKKLGCSITNVQRIVKALNK